MKSEELTMLDLNARIKALCYCIYEAQNGFTETEQRELIVKALEANEELIKLAKSRLPGESL